MRQKDHLTILVCGEEGVGKTSLIATYITQTFPTPSSLPKLMPDVQIPAAESEDECETTLVDSPELGGEGSLARQQLALALGGADAILLLYDAGREETFERLETHWLPFIAKEAHDIPVAIVCSKSDLRLGRRGLDASDMPEGEISQRLAPLLNRFRFIQAGLSCSAQNNVGLREAFLFASRMVLYPVSPLYEVSTGELKPAFRTALMRTFRIHDKDCDGLWSDQELNHFQSTIFNSPLSSDEVATLKSVLTGRPEGTGLFSSSSALVDDKLTFGGLCLLMQMFIERNQLITPWKILAFYDYDERLQLQVNLDSLLPERDYSEQHQCFNQLSEAATHYLRKTFNQFGADDLLTPSQEESIFSIMDSPSMAPWHPERAPSFSGDCPWEPACGADPTRSSGAAAAKAPGRSLREWLALWQMVAVLRPQIVCDYLFRMGCLFEDGGTAICRGRRDTLRDGACDPQGAPVLHAFVFGSKGCGKSGLLGRPSSAQTSPTSRPQSWPSVVRVTDKLSVTLVLTEIPADYGSRWAENAALMRKCDIAVVAFDPAADVEYAIALAQALPSSIPRILVGTKRDIPYTVNSSDAWELQLHHQPVESSAWTGMGLEGGIETRLVQTLADSSLRTMATPKRRGWPLNWVAWAGLGIGISGLVLTRFAYRPYSSGSKPLLRQHHKRSVGKGDTGRILAASPTVSASSIIMELFLLAYF